MRHRYLPLAGLMLLGLLSCSSFHTLDSEVQAITNPYQIIGDRPHIRASLKTSSMSSASRGRLASSVKNFETNIKRFPEVELRDTPEVRKFVGLYTGKARKDVQEPFERRAEYLPTIEKVLSHFQLPLELSNLAFVESKFNTAARSPKGALGLWQFMKPTAQELGLRCNFWNDERKDVLRSSIAAAKYLTELQNRFGDWLLTIAAYNAGPGKVASAIQKAGGERDFYVLARKGLLPRETVNHVSRFIALSMILKNPDVFDFQPPGLMVGDRPLSE